MNNKIASYILIIVSLSACSKGESPSDKPHYPITDQQLRDAATVKSGSYFVYQDSVSGSIDSFWVTNFFPASFQYHSSDDAYIESLGYVSVDNPSTVGEVPTILISAIESSVTLSIHSHSLVGNGCGVVLPFPNNAPITAISREGTAIRQLSTFSENGHSYGSVYEIISHDAQFNTETWIHSWFSMQSGLVKFNMSNGINSFTYYLIRSKIIK